jgi:hypothetical protein
MAEIRSEIGAGIARPTNKSKFLPDFKKISGLKKEQHLAFPLGSSVISDDTVRNYVIGLRNFSRNQGVVTLLSEDNNALLIFKGEEPIKRRPTKVVAVPEPQPTAAQEPSPARPLAAIQLLGLAAGFAQATTGGINPCQTNYGSTESEQTS